MGTLISEGYKALLQRTHAESPGWGTTAHKAAARVKGVIAPSCRTILDYGCGKGTLRPLLESQTVTVDEYDPGIPGKDTPPIGPYDLVVCIDVLEHLEPETVDAVLDDLFRLGTDVFLIIDTIRAKKTLPDGRNAHLTVKGLSWWMAKLNERGEEQYTSWDSRRLEALYART